MELDLAQLLSWGKAIVAAVLALVALIAAGPSLIAKMKSKASAITLPPEKVSTKIVDGSLLVASNSDKLPPVGFEDHVNTIVGAAPFASSDVLLDYLKKGMTEAQVLRSEVSRMGSINTTPVKEVKS